MNECDANRYSPSVGTAQLAYLGMSTIAGLTAASTRDEFNGVFNFTSFLPQYLITAMLVGEVKVSQRRESKPDMMMVTITINISYNQ